MKYDSGTPFKVESIKKPVTSNSYVGKSITETIVNGFFSIDKKWTVKYWNRAAEQLLGVRSKDIVGKNLWGKFAHIIPLEFYAVYHRAFLEDNPVHFKEYWGELGTWVDVIVYHCDDTLSVSFKSSNHSVHPEYTKTPEQKIQIVSQLYRFVTEVTNDCLWEWDLRTKELFWIDGGHKRMFGYEIENALIPQSFWESRLHPDDRVRVLAGLIKAIAEGSGFLWEDEYRFQRANGEYAYVHDRGHIIYEDDKMASRMIGATEDITTRKIAEIKLLESEGKISLIARQTINPIIITDNQQEIVWVNSAFTLITEYEPGEVIGKKLVIFLQGRDTDPATLQYLRRKIKSKQPFVCEMSNYSKKGKLYWLRIQGQPLLHENGNAEQYFSIGTDITDKIFLENNLVVDRLTRQREITNAILTAQENERADIGRDLHDNLNQMLAVIKMYLKMALTNEGSREMYLNKSYGLVAKVIDEIRRIAKNLVVPGMHIIGLFENIKILIADLAKINPLKIEFKSDNIGQGELNEKMQLSIFRIIQEQINNILKHSSASHVVINLIGHGDEIMLLITDNGQGCDLLKEKSGVGIINIKSRAELYRGTVAIVSEPGKGFELKVIMQLGNTI